MITLISIPVGGWNPADDQNGDGCRDGQYPSDPERTAPCEKDAEVYHHEVGSTRVNWNRGRLINDAYFSVISDRIIDRWNNLSSLKMRGCYFDFAAFNIGINCGLQSTFTYEASDVESANYQRCFDQMYFIPQVAACYIEPTVPSLNINFPNMVAPAYLFDYENNPESAEWAFEYLENAIIERWVSTNTYGFNPLTFEMREKYLDRPYADWLQQGKGLVFGCSNYNPDDRGKLFGLATFYLVNHQLAFFAYTERDAENSDGVHIAEWQWNEYVDYDIGQPVVNQFGLEDFKGESGTDRFFIWESANHYEILGREYLRDDGVRVLVLSKIMASGNSEGTSPTTHELPYCYRPVQSDLKLGLPTREITLKNNEGVILV